MVAEGGEGGDDGIDLPDVGPPAAQPPSMEVTEGDLKPQAIAIVEHRRKRPKMTHGLFFEEDTGFKKLLRSFPKIRFRGKGCEMEDLNLLVSHYKRWFKELYPSDENLEDLVWQARRVLQEKERGEDGVDSDPKERLHLLRFEYKQGLQEAARQRAAASAASAAPAPPAASALNLELRKKIEANRQRALEIKRKKQQEGSAAPPGNKDLDMETLWRIEENRRKALELKQKKAAAALAQGTAPGAATAAPSAAPVLGAPAPAPPVRPPAFDDEEDEDVFGFGGRLDDEDTAATIPDLATARIAAAAAASPAPAPAPAPSSGVAGAATALASNATQVPQLGSALAYMDEDDEDVFGFGGGFDGD